MYLTVLSISLGWASCQHDAYVKTEHGVAVTSGQSRVELAVEGSSAFRVTISYGETLAQKESPMVVPKPADTYAKFNIKKENARVSVLTSFGKLSLVTGKSGGAFDLYDSAGKTIIHSSSLSSCDGKYLTVSLGSQVPKQSRRYYGAGAEAGAPLSVNSSTPRVGNVYGGGAHSWAPQYYSVADAYAALAVASHDFSHSSDFWTEGKADFSKYPANWSSDGAGVKWIVEGQSVDLYLLPTADSYAYAKAYAELTGAPRVLPRYAFGFLAGRWGWTSKEYTEETLVQFRSGGFPVDAFISDFFWFTKFNDYDVPPSGDANYSDFGYNNATFPKPTKDLELYKAMGFRFGGIRKPRLGNDANIAYAREKGWLLPKNLSNVNGDGRNINFTTQESRDWFQQKNQHYLDDGVDFWWNDEGEVMFYQFDGWNKALASGVALNSPTRRYFSLNRAYTPGMQRMGLAVWTGDISVSWKSLSEQPAYLLNYGLAGMPYVGCDTGGFVGGNTSAELLARWYWNSAFMTVMRVHSTMNYDKTGHGGGIPVVPHFPWLYGDKAAGAMRKALEMRYTLIPMLYSLGHVAFEQGAPIMRPLLMEFASDAVASSITDQWLVGTGLMTAPVLAANGRRSVYLPQLPKEAKWFKFNTTETHSSGSTITVSVDLDETPLYCRAGTVLPLGPIIQHTGQLPGHRSDGSGQLEVQVYAGADATFTLVEDDGTTTLYENGRSRHTQLHWKDQTRTLTWSLTNDSVIHESMFATATIVEFSNRGVSKSPVQLLGKSGSFAFSVEDSFFV